MHVIGVWTAEDVVESKRNKVPALGEFGVPVVATKVWKLSNKTEVLVN